ncbi:hypothetical protein H2199_006576 [Coniosporium tulheliwenetii]|uniref:Uncharacterized protein n=1 Tax=Coniosporium tulheliwenetii TaxID=3383036 RepID=A0ACC2YW18_9PEZI|nr:hypothetical protein H2199_006576 [Cladosporium sp. JES 115]
MARNYSEATTHSKTDESKKSNEVEEAGEQPNLTKSQKYPDIDIVEWNGRRDPDNPCDSTCIPVCIFNGTDKRQVQLVCKAEVDDHYHNMFHVRSPSPPEIPSNRSNSSILTGLPAGAYGAGNEQMSEEFSVSQESFPHLFWATTSWNMGAALFPLLFVPLTEQTGRMSGYFASYIVFSIFLLPSALARNYATLVITRFFGGGASSVSINIVGGTITDIWKTDKDRSVPMSIFGMTSVVGIALGPFIGSAIQRNMNWRWIYYIQLAFDAGCLPIFWLILKETRGDVILRARAKKLRKEGKKNAYARSEIEKDSLAQTIKISFMRPVKMLMTEFVVFSFTMWISFAWGILFLFQSSIPQTFGENYGFDTFQTGLIQLAISAGAVIATIINPLQDRYYLRSRSRNKESPGVPIPEARLYFAVPGSLLFTAGIFWYGWSSYPHVHWIVPTIAIGTVGIGIYEIYMAVVNYLADAYEKYAASALSAASLGRNTFGAFLPLATQSLYTNLGFQWASSLLGFIGLVLSLAPVVLLWKGPQIRRRSPFMNESKHADDDNEEPSGEQKA